MINDVGAKGVGGSTSSGEQSYLCLMITVTHWDSIFDGAGGGHVIDILMIVIGVSRTVVLVVVDLISRR